MKALKNKPWMHRDPRPDSFTGKIYQTFKEYTNNYALKLFYKIQERTLILQGQHYLIPKSGKERHNRERKYRPITLMNIDTKIFNKISANWIQQHIFKNHIP